MFWAINETGMTSIKTGLNVNILALYGVGVFDGEATSSGSLALAAAISDTKTTVTNEASNICAKPIRADGRCGPTKGGSACKTASDPYCSEASGWCGNSDGHKNA